MTEPDTSSRSIKTEPYQPTTKKQNGPGIAPRGSSVKTRRSPVDNHPPASISSAGIKSAQQTTRKFPKRVQKLLEQNLSREQSLSRKPDVSTTRRSGPKRSRTRDSLKIQSPKRARSKPSKFLDSENYEFRPARPIKRSRLTLSSPELAPAVKLEHSPATAKCRRTMDHPQSNETAIFIIDDNDDDDFVPMPESDTEKSVKKEASDGDEAGEDTRPTPAVSVRFTEEEAEKLLPSPDFPHLPWIKGEWWNEEDEVVLQRERGVLAAALAEWAVSQNYEQSLWKAMLQLYGRTPFDLFRYGLKLETGSKRRPLEIGGGEVINICMSQDLALELSVLVCHPIWHNDITILRFALQYAIYCRVEGHIYPLSAVQKAMAEDAQDEFLQTIVKWQNNDSLLNEPWKRLAGDYYYHSLDHGGPHANLDLKELFAELKKRVKPSASSNEQEKMLFLLRVANVRAVRNALDSLEIYGYKKWLPTKEYSEAYKKYQLESTNAKTLRSFPPTRDALRKWKKTCFLHEVREKLIRTRLRLAGEPDNLLDFPESDPIPFYIFSESTTPSQKAIIRGVVYPEHDTPLPPRATVDNAAT